MNVDNIYSGMIVKNYKVMCDVLGEEIAKGGNARNAQINNWARYFDFDKNGHKFVIKEVYETPMPKDFSQNDVYSKSINLLLLNILKDKGCGNFTNKQLFKVCGFVNEYWDDMERLENYAKHHGTNMSQAKYYYNQLYQHVYSYCTTALKRCLDRLEKRGFINWSKRVVIKKDNGYYTANDDETKEYLNITYKIRKNLGIKYLNMYNKDAYFAEAKKKFTEHGWIDACEMYNIIYATDYIDSEISLAEEDLREALFTVNHHCLDQMHKYVDIDIQNDIKKYAQKINESIVWGAIYYNATYDTESVREKKIDITNMYIEIDGISQPLLHE